MEKELYGKRALITGASTGIGAATALAFAREGASIIINYKKSVEEAKKVQEKAISLGSEAYIFKADVTNEEEVKQLVEFTKRTKASPLLEAGMLNHSVLANVFSLKRLSIYILN